MTEATDALWQLYLMALGEGDEAQSEYSRIRYETIKSALHQPDKTVDPYVVNLQDVNSALSSEVIKLQACIKDLWGDLDGALERAVKYRRHNIKPMKDTVEVLKGVRDALNLMIKKYIYIRREHIYVEEETIQVKQAKYQLSALNKIIGEG